MKPLISGIIRFISLCSVFVLSISVVAQDIATATAPARAVGEPISFSLGPKPTNSTILLSSTPSTPTGLSATASPSGIVLTWNRPVVVEKTQILRRRPNMGETSFTQIAETGILDTTYTDATAVTPGQRYIYKIRVVWGDWTSGESSEVQVDVTAADVATATNTPTPTVTATRMNGTTIVINSDCSLAEAINAANTDASAPGCPAGSGDDTLSLTGNVTLTGDLPRITANITINGNGYTIDGGGSYSMFNSRYGDLLINNVTLTGGLASYAAGAVKALDADVTITNSTIHGNSADHSNGAVGVSRGTLTITDSTIHSNSATGDYGYGGAIGIGGGTLNLENSSIRNNTAGGSGGALTLGGNSTTTIRNSNIYSNSATDNGGAIHASRATSVTVRNSNVYDNSAGENGGAVYGSRSTVRFNDSSVYNNSADEDGGGAYGYRTEFYITRSTFRNNTDQNGVNHFVAQSIWTEFNIDNASTIETPADTATPTATSTLSPTATNTAIATATATDTATSTSSPTATATNSASPTATATPSATATPTATATSTPTPTATATDIPLRKPTNLTASISQGGLGITLNWTAPAGQVDGYEILRRRPRKGESQLTTLVANTGSSAATMTDTTAVEAGQRYVYRVKTIRGSEKSPASDFARVDLPAAISAQQQQSDPVQSTDTPIPTNTSEPPTNTPVATNTGEPSTNTPVPTDTVVPTTDTPVPSATPVPPTNTPVPSNTPVPTDTAVPADAKAVSNVQLASNQPGVIDVSWDAPSQTPKDYRVKWAKVGERFLTWKDLSGNAFPTANSYAITGLDQGIRYKVRVRARYQSGGPGQWSSRYDIDVSS